MPCIIDWERYVKEVRYANHRRRIINTDKETNGIIKIIQRVKAAIGTMTKIWNSTELGQRIKIRLFRSNIL